MYGQLSPESLAAAYLLCLGQAGTRTLINCLLRDLPRHLSLPSRLKLPLFVRQHLPWKSFIRGFCLPGRRAADKQLLFTLLILAPSSPNTGNSALEGLEICGVHLAVQAQTLAMTLPIFCQGKRLLLYYSQDIFFPLLSVRRGWISW